MTYAFVTTNLLDLRAKPDVAAERVSQLHFAEPLRVSRAARGFSYVTATDGYSGWTDIRHLRTVSRKAYDQSVRAPRAVVKATTAPLSTVVGKKPVAPFFVYYGARLQIRASGGGYVRVILPDGEEVLTRRFKLIDPGRRRRRISGADLINEGRRFLGVPYLWGGVSPAGFDCSGFVRAVCGRFGLVLPRDTKDQIKAGKPLDLEPIATGDLLFFDRHVGFAMGRNRVLHCSRGGSGVRINALDPALADYRDDLHRDFREARRII
jgi:hypothetical protein